MQVTAWAGAQVRVMAQDIEEAGAGAGDGRKAGC